MGPQYPGLVREGFGDPEAKAWGLSMCRSERGGPSLCPLGSFPFRLVQVPGLVNSVTATPEASNLPSRTPPRVGSPWRPLHHIRKVDAESDGSTEETDESET